MAFMVASHLRMLLCKLEGTTDEKLPPMTIYFDSKSAIAISANYKDTKHTRHIMRRYHYVRHNFATNRFSAKWIGTEFQLADVGTKLNDRPRNKFLVNLVMFQVNDQTALIQEG